MSPEQARGKAVDKRTDIWAFGCVLYEMLTGRRPFDAEDVSMTLASVMMKEPEWSALPADVPPHIRNLVKRCLEKDRKRRLADIAVAQFLISEAPAPIAVEALPPPVVAAAKAGARGSCALSPLVSYPFWRCRDGWNHGGSCVPPRHSPCGSRSFRRRLSR